MFAYCNNNPVNMRDDLGNWPELSTVLANVAVATGIIAATAMAVVAVASIAPALIAVGGTMVSTAAVATAATTVAVEAATVSIASAAASVVSNQIEQINSESYSVYFLEDENGTIQYVGRVKDSGYRARMAHHYGTRKLTPNSRISGLNYATARGLEEIGMIQCHTLNPGNSQNNQIHGISPRNKKGGLYMEAACNYLSNKAENWVLNLLA